jgi:type I restriction enzyme M protein
MTSNGIVQKLWNYCNILRDDGLSYQDYIEQLTFLLFLKMADERQKMFPNRETLIPRALDWQSLQRLDGDDLDLHYKHILTELGKKPGLLGTIFRKAQNKIQDPAKLKRLVTDLIGREQWTTLGVDVKGDAYEGLLEKNAADVKGGADQYFTPRALIQAIVEVMRPESGQLIHDPACGTGGFLLAVHDYITHNYQLDRDDLRFLKDKALSGTEIVDAAARLCAMNLFLHGTGGEDSITVNDALISRGSREYDMVLTNPPFGKKSSITVIGEDGDEQRETLTIVRDDFWATTSNKQLNFLQHVRSLLKIDGRAAIVVPDKRPFRGGSGRDDPAAPAARLRRSHAPAATDRHLLRAGRKGKRAVLRSPYRQRETLDEEALDLRLPHQPALHAKDQPIAPRGPGRLRRLLPHGEPPQAEGNGPLPRLHLRRAGEAGQSQPGHLLASRREPGGCGQPSRPGRHRR